MASTRTPGITIDPDGRRIIDKEYRGVRICLRLGAITQEQAEQCLRAEIICLENELQRKAHARPRFAEYAARYLAQSRTKRTFAVIALHVRLLTSYLGTLGAKQVHDGTLEPFIADRLAAGVSPTTINRSLEVARTILNRAARSYVTMRDVLGSMGCRRLSRCCRKRLGRPIPSPGTNRTDSFPTYPPILGGWPSLR